MFGIKHSINNAGLYLLSDIVEKQIIDLEAKLLTVPLENEVEREAIILKIKYFREELDKFKEQVEIQRKDAFQFSFEELYAMYGQYERRFLNIEFHKYSESAAKFGRTISGVILYDKDERENVDKLIQEKVVPRTNSLVKFEASKDDTLNREQKELLAKEGFLVGDIYEILAVNLPVQKAFGKVGKKEIPNTIEIKVDPTGFDVNRSVYWLLGRKIKSGYQLTENDWAKFCGLSFYLEPEAVNLPLIQENGFDKDKNKNPLSRFYELEAKLYARDISTEEIKEFNDFLLNRKAQRIQEITLEIKRSTNKSFEKFKDEYPLIYNALQVARIEFEPETLAYHNVAKPIFWDFPSFLHIYLRHCDELAIEGHFENKTKFQYTYKDIRRILKIAIEELLPEINSKLSQGKDFRIYGNKSLYFNGNHYSLHILENGKVAAFHPLENPTSEVDTTK